MNKFTTNINFYLNWFIFPMDKHYARHGSLQYYVSRVNYKPFIVL